MNLLQREIMALLAVVAALATAATTAGCAPKAGSDSGATSGVFSMNISRSTAVAEAGNPAALCDYMKKNGYYVTDGMGPGSAVAYSASYETDDKGGSGAEAGQAAGQIVSSGGRMKFSQSENTTTQLLLCPGSSGDWAQGGECQWVFDGKDGYTQLLLDVACNTRAREKGQLHPGYNSFKVTSVDFTAETAGRSFSHSDVLEVAMAGSDSTAEIYIAKGKGPVAVEFRGTDMPAGTAKVYMDPKGGGAGTSTGGSTTNPR